MGAGPVEDDGGSDVGTGPVEDDGRALWVRALWRMLGGLCVYQEKPWGDGTWKRMRCGVVVTDWALPGI